MEETNNIIAVKADSGDSQDRHGEKGSAEIRRTCEFCRGLNGLIRCVLCEPEEGDLQGV